MVSWTRAVGAYGGDGVTADLYRCAKPCGGDDTSGAYAELSAAISACAFEASARAASYAIRSCRAAAPAVIDLTVGPDHMALPALQALKDPA